MKTVLLWQFWMLTVISHAQPGYNHFSATEFYYSISDETGHPIQFAGNREYTIVIGNTEYHPDSIPPLSGWEQHSMKQLDSLMLENAHSKKRAIKKSHQSNKKYCVLINDLCVHLSQKPDQIRICHGSGIMNLFQPSETITSLTFIPGYYYLPDYASHLLQGLPELQGSEFVNLDQRHFLVSRADFLALQSEIGKIKSGARDSIELEIARKFLEGHVKVQHEKHPLEFMSDAAPYGMPYVEGHLYPTYENNVYIGMMEYRMREGNCTSFKDFFTRIDLNEHTLEHWFPMENTQQFGSNSKLFKVDSANQVAYLRVYYRRDKVLPGRECSASWSGFDRIMYKSYDWGKSWKKDDQYTQLFNENEFKEYEIIDQRYMVGYKFQKIKEKGTGYKINQGVFTLIKDGEVVDTFLTPDDVRFNTNYANFHFKPMSEDSVFLGSWGHDPYKREKSRSNHIYAVKKDNIWQLEIFPNRTSYLPVPYEVEVKTTYENFKAHGDTLDFKNGVKMVLGTKIVEYSYKMGVLVLEQGEHIYLIDNSKRFMYISFDGGATWIFNPIPLDDKSNVELLRIDSNDKISFFDRREFTEESYQFTPIE
jgi:hypothetical protein